MMTNQSNDGKRTPNFEGSAYDFERDKDFDRAEADRKVMKKGKEGGAETVNEQGADELVSKEINSWLSHQEALRAAEIKATVSNGEVILQGHVGNDDERKRVEQEVGAIPGVKIVHNEIVIGE